MSCFPQTQARMSGERSHSTVHDTTTCDIAGGHIEDRILATNPLLEAFGNARTIRNDNSSRFGKFIAIQFDGGGKIVGAAVHNYLLEKTRIVHQSQGERNFHIFYQLMASKVEGLSLKGPGDFYYTNQGCLGIDGRNDANDFKETKECLRAINVDDAEQIEVTRLLAAVLKLGNIDIEACALTKEEDHTGLESEDWKERFTVTEEVSKAAALLGVESHSLLRALVVKTLSIPGSDPIPMIQKVSVATDTRDTLAKAIYSNMFIWLVDRLNTTIKPSANTPPWGHIGVLDIYGFERFECNSLEQFLINYANERLQRQFNNSIFEVEQAEYTREGVDWTYIEVFNILLLSLTITLSLTLSTID